MPQINFHCDFAQFRFLLFELRATFAVMGSGTTLSTMQSWSLEKTALISDQQEPALSTDGTRPRPNEPAFKAGIAASSSAPSLRCTSSRVKSPIRRDLESLLELFFYSFSGPHVHNCGGHRSIQLDRHAVKRAGILRRKKTENCKTSVRMVYCWAGGPDAPCSISAGGPGGRVTGSTRCAGARASASNALHALEERVDRREAVRLVCVFVRAHTPAR